LLAEGLHKIELKAWDVFNNSSELVLDCKVVTQKKILVNRFFNYPNPLTISTNFVIDLDGPTEGAFLEVAIFSADGRPIRKISQTINQTGLRSMRMEWDGFGTNGLKPEAGVYFGRLTIKAKTGVISTKVQKLIIH
jgi:hypothetical protein